MPTHHEERELTRDVQATLIPHGDPYTLDKGAKVTITHRLGGNFTVMTLNGMYRISAADADSLGEDDSQAPEDDSSDDEPADEDSIRDALRSVFDPEIPVNVVDLGLIYKINIDEEEEGKRVANIWISWVECAYVVSCGFDLGRLKSYKYIVFIFSSSIIRICCHNNPIMACIFYFLCSL